MRNPWKMLILGLVTGASVTSEPAQAGLKVGRCCKADGTCEILDEDACALVGIFGGDGTSCSAFTCPSIIGRCCDTELNCSVTDDTCVGEFGGDGTTCENFTCETAVPTMSEWGLMMMALLLLISATVVIRRRRTALAV